MGPAPPSASASASASASVYLQLQALVDVARRGEDATVRSHAELKRQLSLLADCELLLVPHPTTQVLQQVGLTPEQRGFLRHALPAFLGLDGRLLVTVAGRACFERVLAAYGLTLDSVFLWRETGTVENV